MSPAPLLPNLMRSLSMVIISSTSFTILAIWTCNYPSQILKTMLALMDMTCHLMVKTWLWHFWLSLCPCRQMLLQELVQLPHHQLPLFQGIFLEQGMDMTHHLTSKTWLQLFWLSLHPGQQTLLQELVQLPHHWLPLIFLRQELPWLLFLNWPQ